MFVASSVDKVGPGCCTREMKRIPHLIELCDQPLILCLDSVLHRRLTPLSIIGRMLAAALPSRGNCRPTSCSEILHRCLVPLGHKCIIDTAACAC